MSEIKVGEYVRTSIGKIYKLTEKKQEQIENYPGFLQYIEQKSIVKHSFNIIDLIEEGDYVNGEKVFGIEKDPFVKGQTDIFFNRDEVNYWGDRSLSQITDKDIKSIVTREMMKSVEYRLEE